MKRFELAREKMSQLMEFVDVCIGVEPLQLIGDDGKDIKDALPKQPTVEDYKQIMNKLQTQYNFQYVAMTFRETISVNRNKLQALLSDGKSYYQSEQVEVDIIDRVGTGDAFAVKQKPDLKTFFELDPKSVGFVFELNFLGTFLPSQVFGETMIGKNEAPLLMSLQ